MEKGINGEGGTSIIIIPFRTFGDDNEFVLHANEGGGIKRTENSSHAQL